MNGYPIPRKPFCVLTHDIFWHQNQYSYRSFPNALLNYAVLSRLFAASKVFKERLASRVRLS